MTAKHHNNNDRLKGISQRLRRNELNGHPQDIKKIYSDAQNLNVSDEVQLLQMIFKNVQQKIHPQQQGSDFWSAVTAKTLEKTWNNEEDDIYNELLKK